MNGHGGVDHDQQLRNGHRKPNGVGSDQSRESHNQNAADDKSARYRNDERCLRFHDCLKVVSRKDVEGQQQKRQCIGADNGRCHIQYLRCGHHENANIDIRTRHAENCPEHPEEYRCPNCQPKCFLDTLSFPGAEVCGNNGLGCLTDAVCTALDKGADLNDGTIDCQGIAVIPRSSMTEHIKENFELFDFTLSADEMAQLSALDKKEPLIGKPETLELVEFSLTW